MARSDDPLRREDIAQQAEGVTARLQAPVTNPALQLAGALQDIEPTANAALQGYAKTQAQQQGEQARLDALKSSGAKLADAVRAGTIDATQNPWYIQAYNRESAAVRGQADLSKLQVDSTTWGEQNDPTAFAARWNSAVGDIAKGYSGSTDEQAGFAPVAAQFTQQTLQANLSQNQTRIKQERKDNNSMLAAEGIAQAAAANGGTLTPNQAYAALLPAYQNFIHTGGSQADWNLMAVGAVTSAAERTHNAGLLDLLKAPELVHGVSDGGNEALGDGASGEGSPPQPITPITPVQSSAVVPAARWTSAQLAAVVPFGGRVTSGARTPAQNAAVGGVANSQHLAGTAIDVVFPKGTTTDQVRQYYASQGAAVDVIHEAAGDPHSTGDHFHIQGARNPTVVSQQQAPAGNPAAMAQVGQDIVALQPEDGGDNPQSVSPVGQPPKVSTILQPASDARGPALYDIEGVAPQVENTRYRINQAREAAQTARLRNLTVQAKVDGQAGYDAVYAAHGTSLLTNPPPASQLISELAAAHYSPQAIAETLRLVRGDVQDSAGLAKARIEVNGSDPSTALSVMHTMVDGQQNGLTDGYEDRVGNLVLNGTISGEDGARMVDGAISATRRNTEQQRADINFAYTQDQRAHKAKSGAQGYAQTKHDVDGVTGLVVSRIGQFQVVPVKAQSLIRSRVNAAAQGWLATNPGDFSGARAAAQNAGAQVLHETAQAVTRKRGGGTTSSSTSANPRSR